MKILGEHEMECNNCGQIMDMRDLSQVFAHEDCNGTPIDYSAMEKLPYTKGVRKRNSPEFMEKYNKLSLLN